MTRVLCAILMHAESAQDQGGDNNQHDPYSELNTVFHTSSVLVTGLSCLKPDVQVFIPANYVNILIISLRHDTFIITILWDLGVRFRVLWAFQSSDFGEYNRVVEGLTNPPEMTDVCQSQTGAFGAFSINYLDQCGIYD